MRIVTLLFQLTTVRLQLSYLEAKISTPTDKLALETKLCCSSKTKVGEAKTTLQRSEGAFAVWCNLARCGG